MAGDEGRRPERKKLHGERRKRALEGDG